MPRGRMTHNVNASLLHELRMLAQHFMGGRQAGGFSSAFSNVRAKAPICEHPVLECSFCSKTAIKIINGQSVCVIHEDKARFASNRPKFPGDPA